MTKTIRSIHARLAKFKDSPIGYGVHLRHDLSTLILDRLEYLGWTQRQLADAMGSPESFVSRLIHSDANCTFEVVGRVLHALGSRPRLIEHMSETEPESTNMVRIIRETSMNHYGEAISNTTLGPDRTHTFHSLAESRDPRSWSGNEARSADSLV